MSRRIRTSKEAQERVDEVHGKGSIAVDVYAGNTRDRSTFRCLECGYKWPTSLNSVTIKSTGCSKCVGLAPITTREEAQERVDEVHGTGSIVVVEYSGNTKGQSQSLKMRALSNNIPLRAELMDLLTEDPDSLSHAAEREVLGFNRQQLHPDIYTNEILTSLRATHIVLAAICEKLGVEPDFTAA